MCGEQGHFCIGCVCNISYHFTLGVLVKPLAIFTVHVVEPEIDEYREGCYVETDCPVIIKHQFTLWMSTPNKMSRDTDTQV